MRFGPLGPADQDSFVPPYRPPPYQPQSVAGPLPTPPGPLPPYNSAQPLPTPGPMPQSAGAPLWPEQHVAWAAIQNALNPDGGAMAPYPQTPDDWTAIHAALSSDARQQMAQALEPPQTPQAYEQWRAMQPAINPDQSPPPGLRW